MRKTCEKWSIAYRKRTGEGTILDHTENPFVSLPNSWRYWRADPFLLEMDGKTFLFAELFDRMQLRGVIGCCELNDQGAGKWHVVLDEPFHLSYPFVFRQGEHVYMIPESFQAGEIMLYRATDFPLKWERVREIADISAVDSTVVNGEYERYLITMEVRQGNDRLVMWKLDDPESATERQILSDENDHQVRPAGQSFYWGDKKIRPAQDCSEGYGYALNFYEIEKLSDTEYQEKLIRKILPGDIRIQGGVRPEGVHTYNASSEYEVIDYKEYEFGAVSKMARLKQMIAGVFRG